MPDLERHLTDLGADIDWPSTPDLGKSVMSRLPTPWGGRAAQRRGWGLPTTHDRWALAAVAAFVIVAALLAYAPSRDAIASWVNLHVLIQRVEQQPTPPSQPSGPLGERLGLGSPTTLDGAQRSVAWHVTVPSSLGAPDEVYVQPLPDAPALGEISLVYASRPGIPVSGQTGVAVLITEARGQVNQNFFAKMLGPEATVEQVTVAGHQGFWIAGKPHVFFFVDADGNIRNETMRLATNTLIFDDSGTIVRIEGNLTQAQALQIAASMA